MGVFDDPNRDSRGRVISNAYTGILNEYEEPRAQDDAEESAWFDCNKLADMTLAFDHNEIVREAYLKVLKGV